MAVLAHKVANAVGIRRYSHTPPFYFVWPPIEHSQIIIERLIVVEAVIAWSTRRIRQVEACCMGHERSIRQVVVTDLTGQDFGGVTIVQLPAVEWWEWRWRWRRWRGRR